MKAFVLPIAAAGALLCQDKTPPAPAKDTRPVMVWTKNPVPPADTKICSIPLLNALPQQPGAPASKDVMPNVKPPAPSTGNKGDVVEVPAPACAAWPPR